MVCTLALNQNKIVAIIDVIKWLFHCKELSGIAKYL